MAGLFADLVCRPPRMHYKVEDLGPRTFVLGEIFCVRQDLTLVNRSGMRIHCSHFFPASKKTGKATRPGPTVVYLHGNSGSRLEGNEIADHYLLRGMSFFCVDFGGCGISDGSMVTLGLREREDVEVVLDYLKSHKAASHVCLYGRSMGAATALLVAADDRYYHTIKGLVIDSSYASVREIAVDQAHKYPVLGMVAGTAVDALREAVVSKAGFDIDLINVLRAAPLCQAPALFGHASDDALVKTSHTERIFEEYGRMYDGVSKDIVIFPGDHNSMRSRAWINTTCNFLEACFYVAELEERASFSCSWSAPLAFLSPASRSSPWVANRKAPRHDTTACGPQVELPTMPGHRLDSITASAPGSAGEAVDDVGRCRPSSRAAPRPVGHEDFIDWMCGQMEAAAPRPKPAPFKPRPSSCLHPSARDRGVEGFEHAATAAADAAAPPVDTSPLSSPLSSVDSFLGALSVFGGGSPRGQMPPCVPPRHTAHAIVYQRLSQTCPQRKVGTTITSPIVTPMEAPGDGVSAAGGPPRGPEEISEQIMLRKDLKDSIDSLGRREWVMDRCEGDGDVGSGVVGTVGMLLLFLCMALIAFQMRRDLDALCAYRYR